MPGELFHSLIVDWEERKVNKNMQKYSSTMPDAST